MPRFCYNNKHKGSTALDHSSCSGDSNADIVANDTHVGDIVRTETGVIGDSSHDSYNKNIIERSNVGNKVDFSDLGIEEEYFTSEFSFDYDANNDATAVIWSGSTNEESVIRTVSPKSCLGNAPIIPSAHPKSSPPVTTPMSSVRSPTTTVNKRNRVSFDNDVNFRQKSSRRLKKNRNDDKKNENESLNSAVNVAVTPNIKEEDMKRKWNNYPSISTPGVATIHSTHNSSSNMNHTYTEQSMSFQDVTTHNETREKVRPSDFVKLNITPRAVAIDTRVLQSFHGDAVGKTFGDHMISFLYSCSEQGIMPNTLCTTIEKESKSKYKASIANTVVGTRTTHLLHDVENHLICKIGSGSGEQSSMNLASDWNELLPPVYIRAPSNIGNTKNRNAVHAPKRLLAVDSWRILGDLVEGSVNQSTDPMDVSIITNDIALFTDKNVDSHKRATSRFLDRIKPKFEEKRIRSIEIVVLQSGIDALDPNREILSTSTNVDNGTSVGHFDPESDPDHYIKESCQNNRFQVAYIAKVLKAHISLQLSKDQNRKKDGTAMDILFELKDLHRLHLTSILRDWMRSIICSSSLTGRVSFDLPESLDGTQCSIALDVCYSILPYSTNSCHVEGLVETIRLMNSSNFEIIQLIPLDKVDLSLIYGIPLVAKAALDGGLEQYHEMQKIFSSLLKYLASNDSALVLSCCMNSSKRECNSSTNTSCITGNFGEDIRQIFLLMPQITEESNMTVLNKGMLYQYVSNGHQILDDSKGMDLLGSTEEQHDEYEDIIQNSLDLLDKTIFNPCKYYSNVTNFVDESLQEP